MSREQRFTDIFLTNEFQSKESKSGVGSELSQTKVLLEELPKLFAKLNVKRLIDAPCGDCNWIKQLFPYFKDNNIEYLGIDIVRPLVKQNIEKFNLPFLEIDIVAEKNSLKLTYLYVEIV